MLSDADINELSTKALSNQDLYNLFDNSIKIYKYKDLFNFKSLNDAFGPFDIMFILYEFKENYGHWVVLCRDNTTLYFFDPYGFFPDEELKYLDKYRTITPYLSVLLIKSPLNVTFNHFRLQNLDDHDVATCGRWCALYALFFREASFQDFAELFLNTGLNPDKIITWLTNYA